MSKKELSTRNIKTRTVDKNADTITKEPMATALEKSHHDERQ